MSAREAVIDSEQFKMISEIACHQSQADRGELFHFDLIKYREKLVIIFIIASAIGLVIKSY